MSPLVFMVVLAVMGTFGKTMQHVYPEDVPKYEVIQHEKAKE